jgi:leucyl aminopeptidase
MLNPPLQMSTGQKLGAATIHLLGHEDSIADIGLGKGLSDRIMERPANEELLITIQQDNGPLIVARSKEESDSAYKSQAYRALGAKLRSVLNAEKVTEASIIGNDGTSAHHVLAVCEGMALANYQFLRHKTGDRAKPNTLLSLFVQHSSVTADDLNALSNVVAATCYARDLVNETPANLTATLLSQSLAAMCGHFGISLKVLDRTAIADLGMGGLLAVNKGSVEEPTFNIMEYAPDDAVNFRPIVLVGKGVTYDTGGYSIKTQGMAGMKADMGGAAAVAGAVMAIAANRLPVRIVGLIPATDNRIDGKAIVPDDVITMMSGTKVEVLNTDAEGRLILADALHYAKRFDPELVIDLATLTGAAARITAHHGSAMCSDKAPQKTLLAEAGEETYERVMDFPMWREFHDAIRSDVADIKNIGGAEGGNITAATFLHHFTDYPWIHLDIAGPSMMSSESDYRLKGATGVGVRLLHCFVEKYIARQTAN